MCSLSIWSFSRFCCIFVEFINLNLNCIGPFHIGFSCSLLSVDSPYLEISIFPLLFECFDVLKFLELHEDIWVWCVQWAVVVDTFLIWILLLIWVWFYNFAFFAMFVYIYWYCLFWFPFYSRVCGNPHGLIRKYGLMCCRQCFRSNAKEIGFIKVMLWELVASDLVLIPLTDLESFSHCNWLSFWLQYR